MKIRPVKIYKKPEYPNISELDSQPDKMAKYELKRWKNNSAIEAFLYTIGGISLLLPLAFIKSETGHFVCVMVMPPTFISENEVKSLVINELKTINYNFILNSQLLYKIHIKKKVVGNRIKKIFKRMGSNNRHKMLNLQSKDFRIVETTLSPILVDLKHNWGLFYITMDNYYLFADERLYNNKIEIETFKSTLLKIMDQLKANSNCHSVLLFDYQFTMSGKFEFYNEKTQKWLKGYEIKWPIDTLRAQVRDYVNRLKKL